MAQVLSFQDINTEVNHEPRILDVRLAEALGFSNPAQIRPLIERHKEALQRFGELFIRTVRKNAKGRPATENYLNEKQATYICTKSETENATEITIHVVETFYAVRHGQVVPAQPSLLPSDTITPAEQQTIRELVKQRHEETGIAYPALYERIKNKFRLAKYDQMTREQFAAVAYYICTMEPKTKALPAPSLREQTGAIAACLREVVTMMENQNEYIDLLEGRIGGFAMPYKEADLLKGCLRMLAESKEPGKMTTVIEMCDYMLSGYERPKLAELAAC